MRDITYCFEPSDCPFKEKCVRNEKRVANSIYVSYSLFYENWRLSGEDICPYYMPHDESDNS